MYLTHVDATFEDADVFFPPIMDKAWEIQEVGEFESDENNEHSGTFMHYLKK
jgi:dihydrofolate reductase